MLAGLKSSEDIQSFTKLEDDRDINKKQIGIKKNIFFILLNFTTI